MCASLLSNRPGHGAGDWQGAIPPSPTSNILQTGQLRLCATVVGKGIALASDGVYGPETSERNLEVDDEAEFLESVAPCVACGLRRLIGVGTDQTASPTELAILERKEAAMGSHRIDVFLDIYRASGEIWPGIHTRYHGGPVGDDRIRTNTSRLIDGLGAIVKLSPLLRVLNGASMSLLFEEAYDAGVFGMISVRRAG